MLHTFKADLWQNWGNSVLRCNGDSKGPPKQMKKPERMGLGENTKLQGVLPLSYNCSMSTKVSKGKSNLSLNLVIIARKLRDIIGCDRAAHIQISSNSESSMQNYYIFRIENSIQFLLGSWNEQVKCQHVGKGYQRNF